MITFQECYQEYYNRLHRTYNNGSGIPSAGYILLVDAINTRTCSGSTAAFASSCLMDEETDRPILGFVNVCPGKMGVDYPEDRNSLGIFLHEIGHALGFSSSSFPFMRFPNGTARTPRDDKRKPKYKDQYGNYVPSWYTVDYSKAMKWEYGRQLGCDFSMKSCFDYAEIKRQ
ncbi:unnamed protein product [Schistosoma mattheei]|uniref:Leishmanolysin-like peptidase n=1 Tax=Schistosoma mattheei TaxID=31246 RepID=A0A183PG08_9TREM|nr:unnamed protein product [Schistosoma mattheei]